jgi:hypothetical protein
MSGKTPGQAAYEAYSTTLCDLAGVGPDSRKPSRWNADAPLGMRPNERAAREAAAQVVLTRGWPHAAQTARELDELREQLAAIRERLGNLAAGMELSATTSHPSKKSEIERGCAKAVREIAEAAK